MPLQPPRGLRVTGMGLHARGPIVLQPTRDDASATNPELLASRRCRLVVLAVEVGGCFGARRPAQLLRGSGRRVRMLAVAAQRALARSLLELPFAMADEYKSH